LYLADKKQIGEIDPHHGRIELFDASYILRVHFITGTPIVDVIASAGGKVMFSILLPTKKLGSVKIFKGDYTSIPLDSSYLGSFKGGVCVANASSQCVAYVSPTGSIYVPPDWRARISADYSFDKANKMVILDLKDENKHLLARVSFTAQSMLP